MGLGEYLAAKSEADHYARELKREQDKITVLETGASAVICGSSLVFYKHTLKGACQIYLQIGMNPSWICLSCPSFPCLGLSRCSICKVLWIASSFGSVPLKTYLPDGCIDLTEFGSLNLEDALADYVYTVLEREEQDASGKFVVKDVQLVPTEVVNVKLVKCLVQNIVIDMSFSQLGGLCTLCFLEQTRLICYPILLAALFHFSRYGHQAGNRRLANRLGSIVLKFWALFYLYNSGILIYEALDRLLLHKRGTVNGKLMFAIAAFGLIINLIMAMWVGRHHSHHGHTCEKDHHHHEHDEICEDTTQGEDEVELMASSSRKTKRRNLNIHVEGAYLHIMADLIQSVGVMITGAIIWAKPEWLIVHLICTFIFSILVLTTTFEKDIKVTNERHRSHRR